MKNISFIIKLFSFPRYFNFCPDFLHHVGIWLNKRAKINFKTYAVIYWETNNYNKRIAQYLKNSKQSGNKIYLAQRMWWWNLSQALFWKIKIRHISGSTVWNLLQFFLTIFSSRGLPNILKIRCVQRSWFYFEWSFWKNKKRFGTSFSALFSVLFLKKAISHVSHFCLCIVITCPH